MDHVNHDDQQDLEALETLSLTDFALTIDDKSDDSHNHNNHRTPPSPSTEDLFEFCSSGTTGGTFSEGTMMSHAKDIISGGKLIPINDQPINDQQASKTQTQTQTQNQKKFILHGRCESMRELTRTGTTTQLFRNSHSFDYRKHNNKHSKLNYDNLSTKSSSARWTDLVFAPLKVPHEMDLKGIRNRQNTSKSMFPTGGGDRFAVKGVGDHHRKSSWGVLGFLSCRRSGSVAVTMP